MPGISYQRHHNAYIKYVGNVGQEFEEPIYTFIDYKPVPVPLLVQAASTNSNFRLEASVNFGWRAWEGNFPTLVLRACENDSSKIEKLIAYNDEAVALSSNRLRPLTSYFHEEAGREKFAGNALTGVQAYMGTNIPALTGNVVFTDFFNNGSEPHRGILAYTLRRTDGRQNDCWEMKVADDFGSDPAYYVSYESESDTIIFRSVWLDECY